MEKENLKNKEQKVKTDSTESKKTDVKNDKNYDYLESGNVYNFEVGM
ncbi:MAG: hypothetical protein IKU19_00970 [Clostridia bacterium]|nr:hypothetical protein [Clostridia bacterium]